SRADARRARADQRPARGAAAGRRGRVPGRRRGRPLLRAGVAGAPPRAARARLVLVDHNELSQAVAGAEEAEIVAVLDHHRLGNAATTAPIPFIVEPVGCTCTLVTERCRARSLQPPTAIAGMLLSGVLSDTLVLRSPTTTDRDHAAVAWLATALGLDAAAYGTEMLRAAPGLAARPLDEIVDGDRKRYEVGGRAISIGQVEVTGLG